ncbi:hypothetical protein SCE1572_32465 [Sorangium cellulosum So0157-2]|uniref:FAD-binding domain-containing protein n=2 Tax=Sorangium cellulosum TaxID=56 RepID=S4XZX0_SORCE|nr:hypothetical protein SCE1572_32465 [Sorangium cellulosum So0157-2]
MLAGELALARVDVAIVERRESQDLEGLRAGGLYIRTIEVLDQRGIADRFISQGQVFRSAPFARGTLDISDIPARHNYYLGLWQHRTERILADWVSELGVPIYRRSEVTGFAQDDTGVDVELSGGRSFMARQAASYRNNRVLLAGDAAHVHSPMGGQGLNIGVQDAVNLGWKLAQVVHGTSPESLLDTYHAERHPVGARVLRNTMALTALDRSDDRIEALRGMMSELMQRDAPRQQYVAMMSGVDINYDLGEGHPLLGRRMPDLDVVTTDSPQRVFALLHDARPVFLNLGEPGAFDITPWADRVRRVDARYAGAWELPVLGAVAAPTAVLIRPDGYVAWVGEGTDQGLGDALTTWFGPPTAPTGS